MIAEQAGFAPEVTSRQQVPTIGRSVDQVAQYFREAFNLGYGKASSLAYIYRSAIYSCVTLRADMICGLPLKAYRLGVSGRGKRIDLKRPSNRLCMPNTARGIRLADAGVATEVEGSDIVRRLARPNEDWTGRALLRMTEMSLGLAGDSYWRLHGRGPAAKKPPQEISYLRHDRIRIEKAEPTDVSARTVRAWTLDPDTAQKQELQRGEILRLRYPDPNDPDYGALAPVDIARLGADSYQDAMAANRAIFRGGLKASGIVVPPEEQQSFEDDTQIEELERELNRKLYSDKAAGKLAVLKYRFGVTPLQGISPKDAEFISLLNFAIEDAARAYRIPIEFIGGARRTYQNMEAAFRGIWMMALEPEAMWLADELSVNLAPMFGDNVDFVALDLSNVVALQEDEKARWGREREQLEAGVLVKNEWRVSHGLDELEMAQSSIEVGKIAQLVPLTIAVAAGQLPGDSAKGIIQAMGLSPDTADSIVDPAMSAAVALAPPSPEPAPADVVDEAPNDEPPPAVDADRVISGPAYGSDDHRARMARSEDLQAPHEERVAELVEELLRSQKKSVLAKLDNHRGCSKRIVVDDLTAIFDMQHWISKFRLRIKPLLGDAVADAADALFGDLDQDAELDTAEPAVVNFLRRQAQRFATEVNETTWGRLLASLEEGIDEAESMNELADRVTSVMDGRISSTPKTAARTEVLGAFSGGSQLAAEQLDLDLEKTWLSALDARVRDDHQDAHGQTVALNEDFKVGGRRGPGPGLMGDPAQDCNCRCGVVYSEKKARADAAREIADAVPAVA